MRSSLSRVKGRGILLNAVGPGILLNAAKAGALERRTGRRDTEGRGGSRPRLGRCSEEGTPLGYAFAEVGAVRLNSAVYAGLTTPAAVSFPVKRGLSPSF